MYVFKTFSWGYIFAVMWNSLEYYSFPTNQKNHDRSVLHIHAFTTVHVH